MFRLEGTGKGRDEGKEGGEDVQGEREWELVLIELQKGISKKLPVFISP